LRESVAALKMLNFENYILKTDFKVFNLFEMKFSMFTAPYNFDHKANDDTQMELIEL